MIAVKNETINQLLPLLRPVMENEYQRRGYLRTALGMDAPVLNRLSWNLPVDAFISDMLVKLIEFGEITSGTPAVGALLKVIREDVGVDVQAKIDILILDILPPKENNTISAPPHLLFDLLLQMDFKQQVGLVRKVIDIHRTAAFLVHGEPYCGQQLLLTRLFRLKREWKNISPIKIDVSHNGAGRSISHLWRHLTTWFGLPKDAETKEIIQKICNRLFTQDVILIFYTVDYMPPKVLTAWLKEFWQPLVAEVEVSCLEKPPNTHLLMFLVDNSGSVCESDILLAKQFDEPEYPQIPLHLPPVSPFPLDILDDWIDMVTSMGTIQIPTGLTSKMLLEKSDNGIPEFICEEICCHCGHNWEGGLAKWLI